MGHGLDLTFHAIWPGLALGTFPSPFLVYSISLYICFHFLFNDFPPALSFPFPFIYLFIYLFIFKKRETHDRFHSFVFPCSLHFLAISFHLFASLSLYFYSFPLLSTPFHSPSFLARRSAQGQPGSKKCPFRNCQCQ